jgi:hypothetical protein
VRLTRAAAEAAYRPFTRRITDAGYFAEVRCLESWGGDFVIVAADEAARRKSFRGVHFARLGDEWLLWFTLRDAFRLRRPERAAELALQLLAGYRAAGSWPSRGAAFEQEFELDRISEKEWRARRESRRDGLHARSGWRPMSQADNDALYAHWDSLVEPGGTPAPCRMWSFTRVCREYRSTKLEDCEAVLRAAVQKALCACRPAGDAWGAVNIQGAWRWFDPHASADPMDLENWLVPVLPAIDPIVFLASDRRAGLLGDYHQKTVTAFGADLLAAIERHADDAFAAHCGPR